MDDDTCGVIFTDYECFVPTDLSTYKNDAHAVVNLGKLLSTEEVIDADEKKPSGGGNAHLFSSASSYKFDFVLSVEGKNVYVLKLYLSMHSILFKDLFESDDAEKKSVELLKDVGYNEFIELLSVIYPTLQPITATNVNCLLKLASKFKMPGLLDSCTKFLSTDPSLSSAKKLLLAQECNTDLEKFGAEKYTSIDDVKKLAQEPEYSLLNDKTKAFLLDRLVREKA